MSVRAGFMTAFKRIRKFFVELERGHKAGPYNASFT